MSEATTPSTGHTSTAHAVLRHLGWVLAFVILGTLGGWWYAGTAANTYTSTASVLVNPTAGNPFVPSPSSVRQNELTSLETEAQVMRSTEVVGAAVEGHPGWTVSQVQKALDVVVPPNTQILQVSYTSKDRDQAQEVTQAVADSYLANREARYDALTAERITRVEQRTKDVVAELEKHRAASLDESLSAAERSFEADLAEASRNELVSLRAQRTALDNSEAPSGEVIAPASRARSNAGLTALAMPIGGALAGLALGALIAVLLERWRGRIRTAHDVELQGLPVLAGVPHHGPTGRLRGHRSTGEELDTTVRRLRATILDLEPRPDVITVAPAGSRRTGDPAAAETIAQSFAKAGHSVVLVRADLGPSSEGPGIEELDGLSQMLVYERLSPLDLLQPTAEPLLSVLPSGGFTAQSRELLLADRLRSVLAPLIEAGHLVVVQSAGIDSPEGEAATGASDLSILVVNQGRTRAKAVAQVARLVRRTGTSLGVFVVGRHSVRPDLARGSEDGVASKPAHPKAKRDERSRARR